MDQYRCTAPSCAFTAQSVKIAHGHKQQTGHTLELIGTGSRSKSDETGSFGQAEMIDSPYKYILTFTDDNILWEKQTWAQNSSKIPARVEHDQIPYSKIRSITYEEFDLGPTSLLNRERRVWKGWYIILTNGMRVPAPDVGENGAMIARIKERMKLDDGKSSERSSTAREVIKEFREVVLIQCRSCGSRYQQGTPRCLTCGANL